MEVDSRYSTAYTVQWLEEGGEGEGEGKLCPKTGLTQLVYPTDARLFWRGRSTDLLAALQFFFSGRKVT